MLRMHAVYPTMQAILLLATQLLPRISVLTRIRSVHLKYATQNVLATVLFLQVRPLATVQRLLAPVFEVSKH